MSYFAELCRAMQSLAVDPSVIYLGQGVGCAGTTLTDTLRDVPPDRLLEFPVAEDLQMGTAIGMALEGFTPVCIFPRWNFLLLAANQLVNHLDKLPVYSNGGYEPRVIIRTTVPVLGPKFDPGPQHSDDFTRAFRLMLRKVNVVTLEKADDIVPQYQHALHAPHSTLLVEYTALYDAIPSGVKS